MTGASTIYDSQYSLWSRTMNIYETKKLDEAVFASRCIDCFEIIFDYSITDPVTHCVDCKYQSSWFYFMEYLRKTSTEIGAYLKDKEAIDFLLSYLEPNVHDYFQDIINPT